MEVVLSVETWDLGFRGRLGDCAYIYICNITLLRILQEVAAVGKAPSVIQR